MRINSFKHKGLKALYEADAPRNVKGLPPAVIGKLHRQLTAIEASTLEQLLSMTMWKPHNLKPSRPDDWALSVTANWRLTFRYHKSEAWDLNYEDYH